ncbi:capsule assembly Wzi family protein [uncultured Sphingobacterium sp.]|uniref:capsule assembly Wzi family protein n=1 Tax=uncultured Sphingobacterium sp. TaxID=182688 RepID=UPI0025D257ED|nr:capsule assembly Wzi family protein [uncultured Sphingobacterium sp.]
MKNIISFNLSIWLICIAICTNSQARAQTDTVQSYVQATLIAGYTNNDAVPFWMRSNQFGSVPLSGSSGGMLLRAARNYGKGGEWTDIKTRAKSWDWGYGFEARANVGYKAQLQLIDAHTKVRFKMFEAKLGRTKDVVGLNGDTLLSSGNFSVSGNALGIPVLDLRLSEYYRLPWFGGLFSFKGNFSNGYMGKMLIDKGQFRAKPREDTNLPTLLHQKSLYGRLGKKNWRVNFYGGINHQVQWGAEKKVYDSRYTLNDFETLFYVVLGKSYRASGVPNSKLGNQQGSVDVGISYDWDHIRLMAYRQNFYDVGAISKLANIADGLNGITFTNKRFRPENQRVIDWQTLLMEFFYSKNQAGYPWSKRTKSGDEDYYNNYYYLEGWSYKQVGLGSPLIVTAKSVREGQANDPVDFFISNRVVAGHLGARGKVYKWNLFTKLTYAKHYGTFSTSVYGKSTGNIWSPPYKEQFVPVSQFSAILSGDRELHNKIYIGFNVAVDKGKLLNNSFGAQLSLKKVWN